MKKATIRVIVFVTMHILFSNYVFKIMFLIVPKIMSHAIQTS